MRWMLVLAMVAIGFGAFSEPPHADVGSHNIRWVGTELMDSYTTSLDGQYPGTVEDPFFYADGKLVTIMPSVDRRISSDENNRLLWVWATSYLQGNVIEETGERPCPDQIALEFLNESMDGSITFGFQDRTESVPLDRATPFIMEVPSTLSLRNSNGSEVLHVNLSGVVNVAYDRILYPSNPTGEGGCQPGTRQRIENFIISKAFADYFNYTVEAGEPAFFMVRPLLNEQWFRNNHFDSVVFARRQFYRADMEWDGSVLKGVRFREFDVSTDIYGIEHILAIPLNVTNAANYPHDTHFPPLLGEEVYTFVHEFNFTYEGRGWHNVTLRLRDDFNGEYTFQEEILSRTLSIDNKSTEEGFAINDSSRPSLPYKAPEATLPVVVLGGAVVLVILLRFWSG